MKIGANDIADLKIGTTEINEVRLGSVLVWERNTIDPDAQAFLTAAAITDPTIISAINTLVVDFKNSGLWTKMKAIYPFVGGTASTHKWNLKDPRDLDVAFRLVFSGGWNHSSNGITGNNVNTFANTYISPVSNLTVNSTHASLYSRTNIAQAGVDLGASSLSTGRIAMQIKWSDNVSYQDMYRTITTRIAFPLGATPSTRLFIANRSSDSIFNLWRDSVKLSTNNNVSTDVLPSLNLYIGARNANAVVTDLYTSRNYAFSTIGDGLNDLECINLTTAINNFQLALSRQI